MTAGIRILNDSQVTQFDENYQNYAFKNKVTLASTTAANSGVNEPLYLSTWVSYTTQSKNALLAVRCSYPTAPLIVVDNGSTYTYKFALVNAPIGTAIAIYEFDLITVSPANGYGLEVFRADSTVAYSSMYKYMKVVAYDYWIDGLPYTMPKTVATPNPANTYAFCFSMGCGYSDSFDDGNGNWQNTIYVNTAKIVAGGVTLEESIIYDRIQGVPISGSGDARYTMLVVDVTGY